MAKKPEAKFWDWLKAYMGNSWDAQRHEDKYSVGIPDVSYGVNKVNGWIELKAYTKWPTKGLPHFTSKQARWLTDRGMAGGHCFILIKIETTVLLFHWVDAYHLMEKDCNKNMLEALAIKVWLNVFIPSEFINLITMEIPRGRFH